ncbi:lytic transglycosylase domain-containing protein [Acinetobacter larvae]|uniref:Transglycosylase n=1 Tax=Acinetobacter larvae TaxID=1789224 RepID=A0A1B2LY58_9GAMM|nr:lytic transglycosylase domain-containing protein [Acinetobacter larvae]AOA57888.1 transglycosylase [Acinetobacter larvae]
MNKTHKNSPVYAKLIFLTIFLNLGSLAQYSHAEQIYSYRDQQGTTLLTNQKHNEQGLITIKVNYYPDSNVHHYNNWGKDEAAVLPKFAQGKNAYDDLIQQAAAQHNISAGLIKAVMHTESGFDVQARSPVGAQGLMQLMPATAKRFNVINAYDPKQNIFAGAQYLSWLLKRFNGQTELALAAYNAGEGNVKKYGGIPPFRETQDYVKRVSSRYNNLYADGNYISNSNTTSTTPSKPTATEQAQMASNNRYSNRPIIAISNHHFSNKTTGSYSTEHATATAKIIIDP